MENYNEADLINSINEQMTFVKSLPLENAQKCAGSVRSVLEYAVKLFWLKKYNKIPVWVKKDNEVFDLNEAISDPRFAANFDSITISFMHLIRKRCNEVMHAGTGLTLNETTELLSLLDKCVRAIERAIPLTILNPLTSADTQTEEPKSPEERFWGIFNEKLVENGEPFKIYPKGEYAVIGEEKIGAINIVAELHLAQKVLNVGLRVEQKYNTQYSDRFDYLKREFENDLKRNIIIAIPKSDYCYCAVMQFVLSSDEKDLDVAVTNAIILIDRYQKLIPQYLVKSMPSNLSKSNSQPTGKISQATNNTRHSTNSPLPKTGVRHVKMGETFYARTNAEFLNQLVGTNYKAWMKSGYDFDCDRFVWMVELDRKVHSWWIDYIENGKIVEEYVGGDPKPTNFDGGANPQKQKIVFEKIGYGSDRRYVFRGVYRFERYLTPTKRISVLEATEADVYAKGVIVHFPRHID